jgi:hypothetical protein
MAITSRPLTCTALVYSQTLRTWSSLPRSIMAKARWNVDSSAASRAAPSLASASLASAAHCPIAANDLDPRDPDREQPSQRGACDRACYADQRWARRSSRYWLQAAGMEEDVIGGRVCLVADDGERRNSIVPPGSRLPPVDMPSTSAAATPPQVTASMRNFAVLPGPGVKPNPARPLLFSL